MKFPIMGKKFILGKILKESNILVLEIVNCSLPNFLRNPLYNNPNESFAKL